MRVCILVFSLWLSGTACHTTRHSQQIIKKIPAALLGNFKDDYGSTYTITGKEWIQDKTIKYHLLQYNKEGNYFIAKNDESNPSDAGLYSRIDIIFFENREPWGWGYCLTAYKAATMNTAIHTDAANRENPRKGCNGYPFSRMKRE